MSADNDVFNQNQSQIGALSSTSIVVYLRKDLKKYNSLQLCVLSDFEIQTSEKCQSTRQILGIT